jgi:peptidoglycan hydrolase-like protein with peptidoglycan-binding domain
MTRQKKIAILTLALMLMFLSLSYNGQANAANIVKGDTYANVAAVQTVLKKWGYYTGAVDGVFGPKTRQAVINFQKKNGLVADGIVGSKTEAAMGLNLSSSKVSASGKNIVKGDTPANIKAVQNVLKKWGYYTGAVDGVFGPKTRQAVINFQKKNGLVADGIVGSKTEAAMGLNLGGAVQAATTTSSNELYLLAKCIYAEARGEPYVGQVAIGAVVLNRVKDPRFPNTISGVIYQPGAFTAVDD